MLYQILLVDDEPNIRSGMSVLLRKSCRFHVEVDLAENGEQAFEMMTAKRYHLLISDVKMPGMGGIELMKRVSERWPGQPVIMLTGFGDFTDIYETTRYENVRYILKIEEEESIVQLIDTVLADVPLVQTQSRDMETLLGQVDEYIQENIGKALSVNQIAERFHFSAAYLSRIYKGCTGKHLSNVIKNAQMQKAKELLAHPDSRINDISNQLGFSTPSYFISAFKKAEGVTPKQYQQMMNN